MIPFLAAGRRPAATSVRAALLGLVTLLPGAAAGERLPLWEAGVGLAAVSLPDYRGSDERRGYLLPVPYFVYRGEFLKADREGLRGVLFAGQRVELDLSAALSPPVNSRDNRARAGMADLRPVGELGPNLELGLWQAGDDRLRLKLPLRAAMTIEGSPRWAGWVFSPRLDLDLDDLAGSGWRFGVLAGPIFATRRHHAYYYSVTAAEATAARPQYDAPGGYAGTQLLFSTSKRFRRAWVGAFLRRDTLAGASFVASPLVRSRDYLAGGIAVSWIIGESSQRVEAWR
jgi:outer membrane protein